MNDATTAGLLEAAGIDLYRGNAFRITGLPSDADRRTVRRRQQQVLAALEVGADIELGDPGPSSTQEVRAAFDRILGDPRRRLVDELFWLWDTPGASCGCAHGVHRDHDAAVRAHSAALDQELRTNLTAEDRRELADLWSEAARLWRLMLRRSALWDHVRHRIEALDDRQLDDSVVDALRRSAPEALVEPLIELAAASTDGQARLADQARQWPVPAAVVDDRLEQVAGPLYDELDTAMREAAELRAAGALVRSASLVLERAVPTLRRLSALVPPNRHRRTATARDVVAVALNNHASELVERDGPDAARQARAWFAAAREFASDPHTVQAIKDNSAGLEGLVGAFNTLRQRVAQLIVLGRKDVAMSMLRDAKRQLRGVPGAADVDRMIAELDGERAPVARPVKPVGGLPRPARPQRTRRRFGVRGVLPGWRTVRGTLVAVAVVAAVVLGVRLWSPGQTTAVLFGNAMTDNAPAGTCIATRDGWYSDATAVPVVDCAQPHWGEVLGYVPIGAVPSPYPGDDQAHALLAFRCRLLLAQQDLTDEFAVSTTGVSASSWNNYQNYGTCVVSRVDGQLLTRGPVIDPQRMRQDVSVQMSWFTSAIRANPPVGSCFATADIQATDRADTEPVVECDRPHWGEVLGYPVLYQPGEPWPGDDTVYAKARTACQDLASGRSLPPSIGVNVNWPAQSWWDDPASTKYAVCTASQTDDHIFTGGLG